MAASITAEYDDTVGGQVVRRIDYTFTRGGALAGGSDAMFQQGDQFVTVHRHVAG